METTNKNIRQLLEMLDHPEAYTEQQIHDIIYRDEDTRETYRLMVEAKRSCRNRQDEAPVDVDAAWQRFNQRLHPEQHGHGRMKKATSLTFGRACSRSEEQMQASFSFRLVASFIGVLLVSGITFAAIHFVRHHIGGDMPATPQETEVAVPDQQVVFDDTVKVDTTDTIVQKATMEPVVFDNVPLEEMLPEIADHYDATVAFANDKARQLRFRFVWNPKQDIGQVVSDLNQFESLTVTLKDNKITVE